MLAMRLQQSEARMARMERRFIALLERLQIHDLPDDAVPDCEHWNVVTPDLGRLQIRDLPGRPG